MKVYAGSGFPISNPPMTFDTDHRYAGNTASATAYSPFCKLHLAYNEGKSFTAESDSPDLKALLSPAKTKCRLLRNRIKLEISSKKKGKLALKPSVLLMERPTSSSLENKNQKKPAEKGSTSSKKQNLRSESLEKKNKKFALKPSMLLIGQSGPHDIADRDELSSTREKFDSESESDSSKSESKEELSPSPFSVLKVMHMPAVHIETEDGKIIPVQKEAAKLIKTSEGDKDTIKKQTAPTEGRPEMGKAHPPQGAVSDIFDSDRVVTAISGTPYEELKAQRVPSKILYRQIMDRLDRIASTIATFDDQITNLDERAKFFMDKI